MFEQMVKDISVYLFDMINHGDREIKELVRNMVCGTSDPLSKWDYKTLSLFMDMHGVPSGYSQMNWEERRQARIG